MGMWRVEKKNLFQKAEQVVIQYRVISLKTYIQVILYKVGYIHSYTHTQARMNKHTHSLTHTLMEKMRP